MSQDIGRGKEKLKLLVQEDLEWRTNSKLFSSPLPQSQLLEVSSLCEYLSCLFALWVFPNKTCLVEQCGLNLSALSKCSWPFEDCRMHFLRRWRIRACIKLHLVWAIWAQGNNPLIDRFDGMAKFCWISIIAVFCWTQAIAEWFPTAHMLWSGPSAKLRSWGALEDYNSFITIRF